MKTRSLSVLLSAFVLLVPFTPRASEGDTVLQPEHPEPVKLALATGAGHAYALLGVHLEARSSHWAVFAGTGLPLLRGPSGVLGIKAFSRPGAGLVGSLHLSYFGSYGSGLVSLASLSATVGWRFRWRETFLELGIGQSFSYAQHADHQDGPHAGVVDHELGFGALGPIPSPNFLPDVALALGYEF
ncbi:MAG TPA: hypothetical protein VFZ09_02730 [Archangium sp.]|uniref:hypothetical protein n=1 Tax=Archangium sp. TaxID=1872627 RepID=UPI002E33B106|nr:hypothetical protein [Archangium sp.]HEX5745128.1 hypothetical protein [Archangium sp.]